MEVKQGHNALYIGESQENYQGIIMYEDLGDKIDAQHTLVKPEFGGQGMAGELVDALVAEARKEGKKIIPTCSYVAKKFQDSAYADVKAD
ncbi:GNAT family N-acetyltransferase [Peptoniphilus equinus]|uniref:GNAT family N-acetyltransferase n=1 Tax=Peptoniphilus equinus TaxID=3016343 RepID=A0ABY7QUD9_9FIRM|nr:GNAT family N-acetyltransferase [Peptoniphilus equinus]WBW49694.1 GNAT family N-acetyltransferase [Peptoniphilus equinus]